MYYETEGKWGAPAHHSGNWLGMVMEDQPKLRHKSRIALLDEEDSSHVPTGTFWFSKRHLEPETAFGVYLAPFRPFLPEEGLDNFDTESSFYKKRDLFDFGKAKLPDMADALIYTPRVREATRRLKEPLEKEAMDLLGLSKGEVTVGR